MVNASSPFQYLPSASCGMCQGCTYSSTATDTERRTRRSRNSFLSNLTPEASAIRPIRYLARRVRPQKSTLEPDRAIREKQLRDRREQCREQSIHIERHPHSEQRVIGLVDLEWHASLSRTRRSARFAVRSALLVVCGAVGPRFIAGFACSDSCANARLA